MGSKLSFQDVLNDELSSSKFVVSVTNTQYSTGSGSPNGSVTANPGSLYADSTNGVFYVNTTFTTGIGTVWTPLSNQSANVESGHYRPLSPGSGGFGGGTSAPALGDLVGIWGFGAWSATGSLLTAKRDAALCGNAIGALETGGDTGAGASRSGVTETFNSATWAAGAAGYPVNTDDHTGTGTVFAAIFSGGNTGGGGGTATSASYAWNGVAWTAVGSISSARLFIASAGTMHAAVLSGGGGPVSTTELWNGSIWQLATPLIDINSGNFAGESGSQNAAIVAGGGTVRAELWNGSTWTISGNISAARTGVSVGGSQSSAIIAGGSTGTDTSLSEVFNGTTWTAFGNLSSARFAVAGGGGQGAGICAGGSTGGTPSGICQVSLQNTWRKLYPRQIRTARAIGISHISGNVFMQGTQDFVTWPANVYLVVNPSLVCQENNETDFSVGFTINSIQNGGGSTWNYNLAGSPNLLQVVPGNIAFVTGATNPANNGTFIANNAIDSGDIVAVNNPSGVQQLSPAGTVTIVTTMIAKTNPGAQDIVIGKTNSAGRLTIPYPVTVSTILRRLR